jgi:predicted regulator of Ras-like GTPase activity (Roadblock/LC7/MglB family)
MTNGFQRCLRQCSPWAIALGKELVRGEIDRIYVEGEQGFSILTSCGQDAVFLVLASKAAKQGVLMLEIKRTLAALKPF